MIPFWFSFGFLALACLIVSIVYALISPGTPDKVARETLLGFGMTLGGIVLLALFVVLVPWILGK